ncbi:TetR/AcrR family transcriptional regulator [Acidocella sp.]|uniref:TetR/AcrR family transcriptional regulator n=1 Tax=Acidocella sp. TaxID=50710 RepID=UPI003D04E207
MARQAIIGEEATRTGTRETIFLTAERLFAECGFDGVSVRDIAAAAQANIAAVNYHFGSKGDLLLEIFNVRTRELNGERRQMLREAEQRHGGNPPLREVLRALLGPPILWRDPASGKATASRFITRALYEVTEKLRVILENNVGHLQYFVAPLARALPGVHERDICWALHFTLGALHHNTEINFKRLELLAHAPCGTADFNQVLERLLDFTEAGFRQLPRSKSV